MLKRYGFLAVPLLFVGVAQFTCGTSGPFYVSRIDPDYAYLLNSLNVANFLAPFHIDHPGTPLQILGAIAIHIGYWFHRTAGDSLTESVLKDPEFYIQAVHLSETLFVASCLAAVGYVALKLSQNFALSVCLQLTPFISVLFYRATVRVMPETLLTGWTQIIVILVLCHLYLPKANRSRWFAPCLGFAYGIGMAIKFTFLPMILFFALIPTLRQKAIAIGIAILTFIIGTAPSLLEYRRIFDWLSALLIYKGVYGSGEAGFADPANLGKLIANFSSSQSLLFRALLISIALFILTSYLLFFNAKSRKILESNSALKRAYPAYACLLLVILAQFLITSKHFAEHYYLHYLTPALSIFLLLVCIQIFIGKEISVTVFKTSLKSTNQIGLSLLTIVSLMILLGIPKEITKVQEYHAGLVQDSQTINQFIEKDYKNCVQVDYFGASTKENALNFASLYTTYRYGPVLDKITDPNRVFYMDWSNAYRSMTQYLKVSDLYRKQKCVTLRGYTLEGMKQTVPTMVPPGKVEPIYIGLRESLYRAISLEQPSKP
jgi:hypothetical protein